MKVVWIIKTLNMSAEIEKLWDRLTRWSPVILSLLIYWFGVIKANEATRIELVQVKANIVSIETKIDKLEDKKADKETIQLIFTTINRIEDKLDKIHDFVN